MCGVKYGGVVLRGGSWGRGRVFVGVGKGGGEGAEVERGGRWGRSVCSGLWLLPPAAAAAA